MAEQDFRNDHSEEINRKEHTRKNVGAKRVILYGYDADTDSYYPITSVANGDGTYSIKTSSGALKAADEYGVTAISEDATYKYFWFEADDADYYIMRKHKTTSVFTFTKGTGGYTSVYVNETSGPSGSPTWATRGSTF